MSLALAADPLPLRVDQGGVVRVGRTRVTLDSVIHCYQQGDSPERIVEQYPALSLAEAYATVAYYLAHRAEVDAYLAEERRRADELRQKIESEQDHTGMRERLMSRRQPG
jgi:uncharacterized protein (DUF433 family)